MRIKIWVLAALVLASCGSGSTSTPMVVSVDRASATPGSATTVHTTGFAPSGRQTVRFFSGSGYSVQVPSSGVGGDSVTVSVPPYWKDAQSGFTSGAVSLSVTQGSRTTVNSVPFRILQPPAAPGRPGALTVNFLRAVLASAGRIPHSPSGPFTGSLGRETAALTALLSAISNVAANGSGSVSVGTLKGVPVSVTVGSLRTSDQLLMSMLGSLAAGTIKAAAASVPGVIEAAAADTGCLAPGASASKGDPSYDNLARFISGGYGTQCQIASGRDTALLVVAGGAAVGTAVFGALLGVEAVGAASLAVGGVLAYITVVSALGLIGVEGELGLTSAQNRAVVVQELKQLDQFVTAALTSAGIAAIAGNAVGIASDALQGAKGYLEALATAPLPSTVLNPQFDGTYKGSLSGTATGRRGSGGYGGPFSFSVSGNTIKLTAPIPGSGTVDAGGGASFSYAFGPNNGDFPGGLTCHFSGPITVNGGAKSVRGNFSCTGDGKASGTWSATASG
jgi:hypothetical protein